MKVSTDALIAALLSPHLYLLGDKDGAVSLHCRHHYDGGRPLAHYERNLGTYQDPEVAYVATIPGLWAEAVKHLEASHRTGDTS